MVTQINKMTVLHKPSLQSQNTAINQTDREFKIAVMKKLSDLYRNIGRKCSELRTKNKRRNILPRRLEI